MALVSADTFSAVCPNVAAGLTAAQIDALCAGAELIAARYCRLPALEWQTVTEYYDGTGYPDLQLRRRPVTNVASVYLDLTGAAGQTADAFAATALLTPGTDYLWSAAGVVTLLRMSLAWAGFGWWGIGGVGRTSAWGYRGLANGGAGRWIAWPRLPGCVKVTYSAGYTAADQDIVLAICTVAAFVAQVQESGGLNSNSINFIDVSESNAGLVLEALSRGTVPALGSARATLDMIREPPVGVPLF